MICPPCAEAGDLNADGAAFGPAGRGLIENLHATCIGGCVCQHQVGDHWIRRENG